MFSLLFILCAAMSAGVSQPYPFNNVNLSVDDRALSPS